MIDTVAANVHLGKQAQGNKCPTLSPFDESVLQFSIFRHAAKMSMMIGIARNGGIDFKNTAYAPAVVSPLSTMSVQYFLTGILAPLPYGMAL